MMTNILKPAARATLNGLVAKMMAISGLVAVMAMPLTTQAQVTTPTAADIAAGKSEYARWCASCHGGVPSASDKWRVHYATSALMIESAISRFAMMAPLSANLGATSMAQIAAYIADTTTTTSSGTGGGGAPVTPQHQLYIDNCAGCHGASPFAGQARVNLGTSAAAIQSAIARFPVMQSPTLQALNATQLSDIATFIADDVATSGAASSSGSTPSALERGRTAYVTMCAECHGATPSRNDIDKATSASRTMNAIARNKGGMGKLSFLTQAQADDIAVYVASTNPQGEGGCTMAVTDRPTDPIWPLMIGGALMVLLRRRIGRAIRG